MTIVSVTTVGAFTAVGAILVVALMIVPAATAYLLTDRLPVMIGLSVLIGAARPRLATGCAVADASVSGSMAVVAGVLFGLALLLSPSQGAIARMRRRERNARRFAVDLLVVHLFTHEATATQAAESTIGHVNAALRLSPEDARATINRAREQGLIEQVADRLALTPQGYQVAQDLAQART